MASADVAESKRFVSRAVRRDIARMPKLATWIREKDEPVFQHFFDPHPELEIFNARRGEVDFNAMDGLMLTGGPDIAAEFLQQKISDPSLIEEPERERDAWEISSIRA